MAANDFGNRILKRIDRKLQTLESDEWSGLEELRMINLMLDALGKLYKFSESDNDGRAGSEIGKYSDALRRRADNGVDRAAEGGAESVTDLAAVKRQLHVESIRADAGDGSDDAA